MTPPKTKGRSRWPLWTGLGVGVFLVVLLSCCGGAYLFYQATVAPSIGVTNAITEFCVDEETLDYEGAYSQLSQNLQSQIPQSTFVTDNQQYDNAKGPVATCQINTSGGSSVSGSTYTYTLNVTRDITYSGVITVVKNGSNWLINSIDPALPVT